MSIVSLIIAPHIAMKAPDGAMGGDCKMMMKECCKNKIEMKCDMNKCMHMSKEACAAYCDSMKCSPEEKAMCVEHAGMSDCKSGCTKHESSCMEGCDHGCKSKEECMKTCGEVCAKKH